MRRNRRELLALCGAAVLGCRRRKQTALRRLKVSSHITLSASSLHLADELGFFREEGLEIEHVYTDSPSQAIASVAAGDVDVQFTVISTAFLNAVLRGAAIRIVAGREIASPGCQNAGAICALRSRFPEGLKDLTVLKGKRIVAGVSVSFRYFVLDEHLRSAGLSIDDVTPLALRWPESYVALKSGSADAMVLTDEILRQREARDLAFSRSFADLRPNFQYSHIFFGKSLLNGDPELGRRFLRAYYRGAEEFVRGRSPRYMKQFADHRGVDVKDLEGVCRSSFTTDGTVDRESLEVYSAWAFRRGLTPRLAGFQELTDLRFWEKQHG